MGALQKLLGFGRETLQPTAGMTWDGLASAMQRTVSMTRGSTFPGLAVVLSLVVLDAPTQAQSAATKAPEPTPKAEGGKVFLGVRTGYSLPFGAVQSGTAMKDDFNGHIPIWLDVGYKLTPNFMAGVYGEYGFGLIHGCPQGLDCSGQVIRFGLQVHGQFLPGESVNPWVGFGMGYEFMNVSMSGTVAGVSAKASAWADGIEYANLQGGADFTLASGVGVGPFLSLSLGQYQDCFGKINGHSAKCELGPLRLHEWLTLGVRGAFEL
jgi:hypothetical protein